MFGSGLNWSKLVRSLPHVESETRKKIEQQAAGGPSHTGGAAHIATCPRRCRTALSGAIMRPSTSVAVVVNGELRFSSSAHLERFVSSCAGLDVFVSTMCQYSSLARMIAPSERVLIVPETKSEGKLNQWHLLARALAHFRLERYAALLRLRTDVTTSPRVIVRDLPPPMVVRAYTDQVYYARTETFRHIFLGFHDAITSDYSHSSNGTVTHAAAVYSRYEALQSRTTLGCINPCRDCIECRSPRSRIHVSHCRDAPWRWPPTRTRVRTSGTFAAEPAFTFQIFRSGARCEPLGSRVALLPARFSFRWRIDSQKNCTFVAVVPRSTARGREEDALRGSRFFRVTGT